MTESQDNKERDIKPEPATAATGWKRLLNYQSIVKQVPFFLFLTALAILYI